MRALNLPTGPRRPMREHDPMSHAFGVKVGDETARDNASRQGAVGLAARRDLSTYRRIMTEPTWEFITEAVIATRAYETGLEAGLLLLRFTEDHRDELTPPEFEGNMVRVYGFVLEMLDRLDQWDAYLAAWAQIRTRTSYTIPEDLRSPVETMGMTPYVMRRDRDALWVHFLWPTQYRKAVIERKVRAKRQGRRLGNLLTIAKMNSARTSNSGCPSGSSARSPPPMRSRAC